MLRPNVEWAGSALVEWDTFENGRGVAGDTLFTLGDYGFTSVSVDPLSDPAAAWELMKRERVTVSAHEHSRYWRVLEHSAISGGRWHEKPETALCLYVLAVHSIGTLEPLITPLLERIREEGLDK